MSISPVSSASVQPSQADSDWQQFSQLIRAIQSGDNDAAQQAYANFSQTKTAQSAGTDTPLGKALSQIGSSLESGDMDAAQQALASISPHGRHHHHRGGGAEVQQQTSAPANAGPSDPNAPGANLNISV